MVFRFKGNVGALVSKHANSKGGPEGFFEFSALEFTDDEGHFIIDNTKVSGYLFIDEVVDLLKKVSEVENIAEFNLE